MIMKKKLLILLPAILVLSACSGLQNNKENNDVFLEDTLAHEELFGGNFVEHKLGEQNSLKPREQIRPYYAATPEQPNVGVQYLKYKENETDYYAIRYVAAIESLSVTAKWTRDVSGVNGNRKNFANLEVSVTNAYEQLSEAGADGNEAPILPSSVDAKYNYFVVYTLRKIPMSEVNSYLFGYLTITNLDGSSSSVSLARVSKLGGGNSFKIDHKTNTGYFLRGRVQGTDNNVYPINDTPDSGYYGKEQLTLTSGDSFGIFKIGLNGSNELDHFQFFGYESYNNVDGKKIFPFVGRNFAKDYTEILTTGTYVINIKEDNSVEFKTNTVPGDGIQETARFYLIPNDWGSDSPRFQIHVWNNSDASKNEDVEGYLSETGIYKFTINNWSTRGYDRLLFYRLDPSNGSIWNQTGDMELVSDSNVFNIRYWSGGDWNI